MTKDSNHPLAHVLKLNDDPGYGMKANRIPAPGKPDVQVFSKGGPAKSKLVQFYAKGGPVKKHDDAKQDKALFSKMMKEKGLAKGGPACMAKGGKAKGGKKVVMGTMKEARDVVNALKSVKKPMTPPPGLAAASPMGMSMKKGGKVKMAAGGAAKTRLKEPMPKPIKKVPYVNGG